MYLGIDCGTQGTKALLIDRNGHALGRGYAPHQLVERASGAREQDPAWWVKALVAAVRAAVTEAGSPQVEAIGVSGQQHGLVVLDEHMQVIRPAKLWNDTETAPQNAELIQRFGGKAAWFERFGVVPLTGYTVSKLLWIEQNAPEDFARIRHILLPHQYLNFWLTGELHAEPGDSSGTGFFNHRTRTWTREVLDEIDGGTGQLFRALPPLSGSDSSAGSLLPERAAELGIAGKPLVSSGGGDNMMGAIGTGNVREGVVTLSLGTSSTVYSFQEHPSEDPSGNVAPFCASSTTGAGAGGWLPLVCTMNCTNVVTAACALVGKTVLDIDAALAATAPGADGLVFLPFLNGERTPDLPEARGTLTGLNANNFTPSHLIRAAVEGVSFGVLAGLDRILNGAPAEVIQVIGGGARSRAWRQLLADATGARVVQPAEAESGCLGAAIQAAVALAHAQGEPLTFEQAFQTLAGAEAADTLEPDPALQAAYDQASTAYTRQLKNIYPEA